MLYQLSYARVNLKSTPDPNLVKQRGRVRAGFGGAKRPRGRPEQSRTAPVPACSGWAQPPMTVYPYPSTRWVELNTNSNVSVACWGPRVRVRACVPMLFPSVS